MATAREGAKAKGAKGKAATAKPRRRYTAELKTKKTAASAEGFIKGVTDPVQRADSLVVMEMMRAATKQPAKMWGSAIVGYGDYHFIGASGREGDWFICGFSPRKGTLTLYMLGGWRHTPALLKALGKHKVGGGCLYLKRLTDIDRGILKKLIAASLKNAAKMKRIFAERAA